MVDAMTTEDRAKARELLGALKRDEMQAIYDALPLALPVGDLRLDGPEETGWYLGEAFIGDHDVGSTRQRVIWMVRGYLARPPDALADEIAAMAPRADGCMNADMRVGFDAGMEQAAKLARGWLTSNASDECGALAAQLEGHDAGNDLFFGSEVAKGLREHHCAAEARAQKAEADAAAWKRRYELESRCGDIEESDHDDSRERAEKAEAERDALREALQVAEETARERAMAWDASGIPSNGIDDVAGAEAGDFAALARQIARALQDD